MDTNFAEFKFRITAHGGVKNVTEIEFKVLADEMKGAIQTASAFIRDRLFIPKTHKVKWRADTKSGGLNSFVYHGS